MDMEELREELNAPLIARKVTLKLPFIEITFERDEVLCSHELSSHLDEILNKAFIERWVMHYDLTKEDVQESIAALDKNAEFLDGKISELRKAGSKLVFGVIRILEELRSSCNTSARKIYQLDKEIQEGNNASFGHGDRLYPPDWLPTPLIEFRLRAYPLIKSLIDLLPDDDPIRDRSLATWYEGRRILSEAQKDKVNTSWRLAR